MIPFPDDSQCPLSADGTEKILGGSVGLNRILLFFKNRAFIDRAPQWGLYLINAATVFRNVHSTWKPTPQIQTLSESEAIRLFQNDVNLLITYVTSYLSMYTDVINPLPAPMIVYYPNYKKIPMSMRKTLSDKEAGVWTQYEHIRKTKISLSPERTFSSPYIDLWEMQVGTHAYPHVELVRWLQEYLLAPSTHSLYRWGHIKAMMISHCALDLHIKLPLLELIESHQGVIKPPNQFYTKLNVPKDIVIPFNSVTHQLFGDSTLIQAKAQRGAKKKLLEMSQAKKWTMSDTSAIISDAMKVLPDLVPSSFVRF